MKLEGMGSRSRVRCLIPDEQQPAWAQESAQLPRLRVAGSPGERKGFGARRPIDEQPSGCGGRRAFAKKDSVQGNCVNEGELEMSSKLIN